MDRPLPFRKGAHLAYHGHPCVYLGLAANGRCQFGDGEGWFLEIEDPETGLPVWPLPQDVRRLMADMRLILRADPLDDPVRRRARSEEGTREELANAKCKHKPGQSRDPWFYYRKETLEVWNNPEVEQCSLTKPGITAWYETNFDVEDLKRRFGRLPSDRTFRKWIQTRGQGRDLRPADFASFSGLGTRRRRIDPVVLAIVKHWVVRFHAKPRQSKNAFWREASDDVDRYRRGEKLKITDFEKALEPPKDPKKAKMCTRRIFNQEIERAAGGKAAAVAWNQQARKQRFGGGGVAQEPVRFLQYVQIDATPFPAVFAFDAVRGMPVGTPTVTIALCIFTRVILGWDITYEPPSSASFMRTMLHTALPKHVPASFECEPKVAAALEELAGAIVGHMLVDNAREQTARAAQDAGGDIGFGVRWAGANEPTHKGHVESCLGTLQLILKDVLPAATWDIPLMRRFGYDPSKQAIVTLEQFREIFAEVVARYHTTGHTALLDRYPVDVWLEQRDLHGLDWVTDIDHFRRAIGNVDYVGFRGDGFGIEGLRYGSDGSDHRWPVSNEDLLFNIGLARGVANDTVKRSFTDVKVKYDPNDLGVAWIFDEHLRAYVEVPCTMRRYAEGLPLWLHNRLKDWAREKRKKFDSEHDMIAVRDSYAQMMSRIAPEAVAAERRAAARYAESSQGRAYLGDAVKLVDIKPSPSGMETIVQHGHRVGTRGDATKIAPRSSNRNEEKGGRRGQRDQPGATMSSQAEQARQDAARAGRRLDVDSASDGYLWS